jgi:cytochrome P450
MNAPLREISDLPAPRGLPILGNALQVEPTRLHAICEEWRRQLGDYYRFSIGRRRFLVVGDAETIAQTLRDRPDGFQRTERLNKSARAMGFGGVFSANGEQWKRQRPMVMAGFDPAHIRKYFPTLVKVTERFLRRWQRAASSGGTAGTPIDLTADLMRYTVDVTAGLAFGADINTIESDEDVIQRHLDKVLPALAKTLFSPFSWLRKLPLPANRALDGHLEALRIAVDGFIAGARERMQANPALRAEPTNLIEAMVAARDREGQRPHRPGRRRQRPHHAARGGRHHCQQPRVDDLPALAPSRGARPRARRSARQRWAARRCRRASSSTPSPTSRHACTRPCASSRSRR